MRQVFFAVAVSLLLAGVTVNGNDLFQQGNAEAWKKIDALRSLELSDNRIGTHWFNFWNFFAFAEDMFEAEVFSIGLKNVRFSINDADWDRETDYSWSMPELSVDPRHDQWITAMHENGVTLRYELSFWDKAGRARGEELAWPRFQTEEQIERYTEFVRFIVEHFRGRIRYYEIWGEPNREDCIQWIRPEDYVSLVAEVAPIIKQVDPTARIVIGATDFNFLPGVDYLFSILDARILRLVDGISWHPMYCASPEHHEDYTLGRELYYSYPDLVRRIKETAESGGFSGEYFADELSWRTEETQIDDLSCPHVYAEAVAAKYLARGIVMNLGMDVRASHNGLFWEEMPTSYGVVKNLCTVMAGHESIDMSVGIQGEYDEPVAHCAFRYATGDRMFAIWRDGEAGEEDPGVSTTLRFPGLAAGAATGIDVLRGVEQELILELDGGDTIVRNLLVRDYPIFIRLSDVTLGPDYEETAGDGFHRLGETGDGPDWLGETGGADLERGGEDRDGDGVPDDEDLCPDWPGSEATSGC